MKKIFFTICVCLLIGSYHLNAEEKDKLKLEIYKNLRCLICQGQSIADSNSDFAQTIKLVVQDQIKKGKSKNEIYSFLVEKYGEWIIYKPKINKSNFLLWFLPYFVLILGVVVIFVLLRKIKNNKA
tara:strand:- start:253 stop:630 length:378 start_codon:yes stop_codon:yes gene_type:complete